MLIIKEGIIFHDFSSDCGCANLLFPNFFNFYLFRMRYLAALSLFSMQVAYCQVVVVANGWVCGTFGSLFRPVDMLKSIILGKISGKKFGGYVGDTYLCTRFRERVPGAGTRAEEAAGLTEAPRKKTS